MRVFRACLFFFAICPPVAAQNNANAPGCGSPDAVLAHYRQALGGDAALGQMQTLILDASATEPHTFNPASTAHYKYRFEWKAPGKVRVRQHYALTFANWIFDGANWSLWNGKISHNEDSTPMWRRELKVFPYNDDPQFLMFRVAANPLLVATTKDLYRRYELQAGVPGACRLGAFGRSEWGVRHDLLTFDAAGGLLKTWTIEAGEPGDRAQVEFQFGDYEPAGNVLIPRSLTFDFYGTEFRINKAVVNAPLKDSEFVPRP
jgi:hypothetical protein